MYLTSSSHPLRIDELTVPGRSGLLGLTLCPGKRRNGSVSGDWRRDLRADLVAIEAWGAEILVSLLEPAEYEALGVADLGNRIPPGILHLRLPIPDGSVPDRAWETAWREVRPYVRAVLRRGGRVCMHCRGGLGRTGLLAARILVEEGTAPGRAILLVRAARPGSIETEEQESWVRALAPLRYRVDRFRGCLLAGACGDALGAAVEFLSLKEIRSRFGPEGIRDYGAAGYGGPGRITDDTQMSLFTAEGLLRSGVRERHTGDASIRDCLGQAYLRWYVTQGGGHAVAVPMDGWLAGRRELHSRRAPGNTCLEALGAMALAGRPAVAQNDSKGCGGVMRTAPAGLFAARSFLPERERRRIAFDLGRTSAALTHGHPSGRLSAGALALLVADLVCGVEPGEAVEAAIAFLAGETGGEETRSALERARRLSSGNREAETCLAELGPGWVGEEALATAVFCTLRASSTEEGIVMAVNIDGDSDSTGAIAGNMLGARNGADSIPLRWSSNLELADAILAMAEDLEAFGDAPVPAAGHAAGHAGTRAAERIARLDEARWLERYPLQDTVTRRPGEHGSPGSV